MNENAANERPWCDDLWINDYEKEKAFGTDIFYKQEK